ncbi:hypothetical protein JDV02_008173 [Purpureocillium takamizusanense]|uniref:Zn(2)-C6 fungal-type domain-containing protein n=1 Tax=Purpureocillium takamizusanense TaxID=2060973 RepID=A0A9Q8QN87_9HYPO|nr:uncharacterized protein JDV02_008173 [Purpureocillium takamizusanense]UNI22271.1 hypothetical protein JDV02_008173 [Purpureocillium takamizusanense]
MTRTGNLKALSAPGHGSVPPRTSSRTCPPSSAQSGRTTMASPSRAQTRKIRVLACEACRARRTRCDGRKPVCGTCEARSCECSYPQDNKRPASNSVEDQLSQIRSQLDRIESTFAAHGPPAPRNGATQIHAVALSPWTYPGSASSTTASPGSPESGFPYMKLQTSAFTGMAGLGEDYGNTVIRLEQDLPAATGPTSTMFVLQHAKVMSALQSFSDRIHPWYPILEDRFSDCVSSFLANSFERGADAFLVLMVLASGTIVQEAAHSVALEQRPDAMYLSAAMEMLHLVFLEQSLRSVQCLVAMSIHYYLLLKPLQAHDLAVLAIKKAQNLHLSGAIQREKESMEHWTRVYRVVLLIEGELVVPLQLADSNAWESEEDIALPTGTDIWTFETDPQSPAMTPQTTRSDDVITYLLAEIAMRRMLRRNTTAITVTTSGSVEYAPLVAKELEAQLEQWFSYLPEPLRFSREFDGVHEDGHMQIPFLRTQYWACMVSFYWPSVVQVMESDRLTDVTMSGCETYFRSYREFINSATVALDACLPNKWTLYASIFAISLGAYMGASSSLLASTAGRETWAALWLARDAFGEECRCSPSLSVMADSIKATLSNVDLHRI